MERWKHSLIMDYGLLANTFRFAPTRGTDLVIFRKREDMRKIERPTATQVLIALIAALGTAYGVWLYAIHV